MIQLMITFGRFYYKILVMWLVVKVLHPSFSVKGAFG